MLAAALLSCLTASHDTAPHQSLAFRRCITLVRMYKHTCAACHQPLTWTAEHDRKGRKLATCGCPGRWWRASATEKSPRRRPRWRAATRERAAREKREAKRREVWSRPRRPPYDAVLPVVRAYRELVLACQLAADCQGIGLAAWIRRTLAGEAGRELRRRQYRVPRRVLDLAAAGRLEQLEQLAATLAAGEAEEAGAAVPTSPSSTSAE